MVELSREQWTRLYMAILVLALRMTYTRSKRLEWTARDRAQEAVQNAFERYLHVDPPEVTTMEKLQTYLAGAVRSALGNVKEAAQTRSAHEATAATEDKVLGGGAAPSALAMQLDAAQAAQSRSRAARIVGRTRERLRRNGDTIALGTMECVTKGKLTAKEQAEHLGCAEGEIYKARERRSRVLAEVVAAYRDDDDEDDGDQRKEKN